MIKKAYVAGAIGPLPDANEKFIISSISSSCIIIGMIGLVILAIYEIRNKKKISLDNYPFFPNHLLHHQKHHYLQVRNQVFQY